MKISDFLDVMEDDSVSIRERNVIPVERIVEATMSKINSETQEEITQKDGKNSHSQ